MVFRHPTMEEERALADRVVGPRLFMAVRIQNAGDEGEEVRAWGPFASREDVSTWLTGVVQDEFSWHIVPYPMGQK